MTTELVWLCWGPWYPDDPDPGPLAEILNCEWFGDEE
jgi:hypothetical protein